MALSTVSSARRRFHADATIRTMMMTTMPIRLAISARRRHPADRRGTA
jgi:hypothetical protein